MLNQMRAERRRDARQVPSHSSTLSTQEATDQLQKLSLAYRRDASILELMSKTRKAESTKSTWQPRQLERSIKLSEVFPSKTSLLQDTSFGKPNICKSYTVVPALSQVSVVLFKSGFLDNISLFRLARALPHGLHTLHCIQKYHRMDFRPLLLWPLDWDTSESINQDLQTLRQACLFHYDMDVAAVQRFCQGRFTGQHRRTDQMLRVMQHILPAREFWELVPPFVDGIPNALNASVPQDEYQRYRQHGNMPDLDSMPDLVMKGLVKEDARHLSLLFDARLLDYIPHAGLIAMGIVSPKYKKPRIYRHGSLKLDATCHPINSLVNIADTEPTIEVGRVVKDHCHYLWRMAATFPHAIIDSYDDDISGAFPQMVFHPEVARANFCVYDKFAILSTGCHFGGNFGPPDWEPYARARCYVAAFLFDNATYQVALNTESLDLMEFPTVERTEDRCCIVPQLDSDTPPVTKNGKFSAEYRMYVDDLLSACLRNKTTHHNMAASSIEAVYLLLGYPGPIKQPLMPPSMAWDKMEERPIGTGRVSLGLLFEGRDLTVSIEDRKVQRLLDILQRDWNRNRKMFTVLDAAVLIGNVIACSFVCAWLKWSLHHLMSAMHLQLKKNARRLRKRITKNQSEPPPPEDPITRKIFKIRCLDNSFARQIWRMKEGTAITTAIYEEVDYIARQCHEHLNRTHVWKRPISHIVDRPPDALVRSDASTSWGAGGACAVLTFWWQLCWMDILPAEAMLAIQQKELSINVLELFGVAMGLFASAVAYLDPAHQHPWQPRVMLEGDNTTAESWLKRFTNDSKAAQLLTKLMAFATKRSGIGSDVGHIEGRYNYFADAISRGSPDEMITKKMRHLPVSDIRSCFQVSVSSTDILLKRFHPSPELLSAMVSCLCQKEPDWAPLHDVKNWGQMSPEPSIIFALQPKSWAWTTHNSYLCRGHTLKGVAVREATIRGYLDVAAAYIQKVTDYDVRRFYEEGKPFWQWHEHPFFESMLREVRRWQGLPKRAEGLSKSMIEELIRLHQGDAWDSFGKCLIDWLVVAIHTGYRRIEWCQPRNGCTQEHEFERADDPSTDPSVNKIYAVLITDITFVDKKKRVIRFTATLCDDLVYAVRVRWRYQKNGQNGQMIHFARNPSEPALCIVRALLRIVRRHSAWNIDPRFPLAVFKKNKGSRLPSWFGKPTVVKKLQALGDAVYGVDHDPPLRFTLHSPRVGACMLLHAAGEKDSEIQKRLRWESDAFRMYLRDVPLLALRHTMAISSTDVDCFLWSAINPTFEEAD